MDEPPLKRRGSVDPTLNFAAADGFGAGHSGTEASATNALLEAVLAEYLERQETQSLPCPDEYLERYPELADELQVFFRNHQWLKGSDSEEVSLVGQQVGAYRLEAEIARGGMGIVYRARQAGLDRAVAVKLIGSGVLASHEQRRRFRIEAEAASRLQHPNIVPIYEIGSWQGHSFYSMPLIEGPSLEVWVRERSCRPAEAAQMVATVARAVAHAHLAGIVHRDLKPANILIDDQGRPQLADFGLAKAPHDGSLLTQTGQVLGTPHYMSPEQAAGKHDVGPATDIYALGAILYSLLTGRPPHGDSCESVDSPPEILRRVLQDDPVPPREICREVPGDLQRVCLKCLQRDPGDRYRSAEALAEDLDRFGCGEAVDAAGSGMLSAVARALRRDQHQQYFAHWGRALLLMGVIIFAAHVAIFAFSFLPWSPWLGRRLPRAVMFAGLAGTFYCYRRGAVLPRSAAERPVWSIWVGYLASLTIIHILIHLMEVEHSILLPITAALGGFGFIAMGGHIWGGCQILGGLFFAAAIPSALFPATAPLWLGTAWLLSLATLAYRYSD